MFCWRGRKVVIYNHYDSYPSCMGAEIFRQLVELLRRFRGDVRRACQCWGELVHDLTLVSSNEHSGSHPFNEVHAFDDIENALRSTLPLAVCDDDQTDVWIEFVWTVDLDEGTLVMQAHDGRAEWSFVDIYRGRALLEQWIAEAEESVANEGCGKPFAEGVARAAAVTIQASARRFLEVSRGLRPGGVLAKLAAMRFHHACEIQRARE